ncbi:TPA: hypothetical protein UM045_003423 [Clostridioides difficile]|uniref:hypothetical protein n=1 Tax=Clostridioides difficile TaxID=1496 RepID=UPI00038D87AE|nr:hypothetical protein [Clostridioides difficile]EQG33519.1 hypothetical protein QIM_3036 [Clostridioides difficile DA00128]EQJ49074.1 hypothetical protein QSG_0967 [Clostridioides difficile P25]EJA6621406.1 hypothetical protein [Clostridioides difficile]EJA6785261.1 hypothetical protein [Clostridioides difficile]EQE22578.1 hypothetical protein QAW_0988 [Clostridioides difficile CD17]
MLKEGTYCVSIEGKLSSEEVELGNVTITMFVDGNIILKMDVLKYLVSIKLNR